MKDFFFPMNMPLFARNWQNSRPTIEIWTFLVAKTLKRGIFFLQICCYFAEISSWLSKWTFSGADIFLVARFCCIVTISQKIGKIRDLKKLKHSGISRKWQIFVPVYWIFQNVSFSDIEFCEMSENRLNFPS